MARISMAACVLIIWTAPLFWTGTAAADLPPKVSKRPAEAPPQPAQPATAKVQVRSSGDNTYRIIIPQQYLRPLRQGVGQAEPSRFGSRSLFAALALSAGMISLIWVRRGSPAAKAVLLAAVVGGVAALAGPGARANLAPPPPEPDPVPGPEVSTITIEISRGGDVVQLFVPDAPGEDPDDGPPAAGADPEDGSEPRPRPFGDPPPSVRGQPPATRAAPE